MTAARQRILVINPNSNGAVTAGIDAALAPFRLPDGPEIACETLAEGPFGIETERDIAAVAPRLAARLSETDADAAVIACYSDPGLWACREAAAPAPVFGIAECGLMAALARADRVGVIALSAGSVARHLRHARGLGIGARIAGERAAELSVAEAASDTAAREKLRQAGHALVRADGAGALVLGCAGMARHRRALETELGVPVIDPCQAAVAMALGALAPARDQTATEWRAEAPAR